MTLFRPTDLRQLLDQLGKRPSRALSQNFLIDGNILNKIITAADVKKGDTILEIGSGPGALTQALLKTGARVIAIEKDRIFAEALKNLQTEDLRLSVIEDDFLELDLSKLLQPYPQIKVVANIPYNITTPIITRLADFYPQVHSLTLMVQKEVAMRFVAKKSTPDYSSLTLFLQYYTEPSYCFTVEPTCFYPPPTVRSAVVHLLLKKPEQQAYPETLIRTAFQQRRKMLRSTLKSLYPQDKIETALNEAGIDPKARPEELSLGDFLKLQKAICD